MMIAGVVVLGVIMSILDTTVVNVAINTLARDFDTELSTIQWIVTGYTLALATVIPVTGWAADRFGTKRLYMISIGLFVAGSALSGAAWSAESLIAFRVIQGLGGGMLMPAGMTILTRAAGAGKQHREKERDNRGRVKKKKKNKTIRYKKEKLMTSTTRTKVNRRNKRDPKKGQ